MRQRLRELRLEDPECAPLLAFRDRFVDLSTASIATDELKPDALTRSQILRNDVQAPMNWSRLLAAFAGKHERKPDAPPPRIEINHSVPSGAQADIADQRNAPAFVSRIDAFDPALKGISTKPDDSGQFIQRAATSSSSSVSSCE